MNISFDQIRQHLPENIQHSADDTTIERILGLLPVRILFYMTINELVVFVHRNIANANRGQNPRAGFASQVTLAPGEDSAD